VFLSDNGGSLPYGGSNTPLRGEKANLFEGGIHVPCLMQWKGRLAPGKTLTQVAGGVDLCPTLAALAGAKVSGVDGRDLGPALFEGRSFERELFWRTRREDAYLRGQWKYIRTGEGQEFLFDLEHDPVEQVNRTGDRAKLQELKDGYQRVTSTLPAGPPR
jgi:arylsulfatase A-like enzyme